MFCRFSCSLTRRIIYRPSSKIFSLPWESQRAMSIISVHSTFPASLLHFQPLESSSLFDFNASRGQERVLEDEVTVSKDGLVYSTVWTDLSCAYSCRVINTQYSLMVRSLQRSHFLTQYLHDARDDPSAIRSIPRRAWEWRRPQAFTDILYSQGLKFSKRLCIVVLISC